MKPKFETVGDIKLGNSLFSYEDTTATQIAEELLHSRWTGLPVIDRNSRVVGVVSEQDLLRALRGDRPLEEVQAREIMNRPPIVVNEETTLEEASKIMEKAHIHRLPVVRNDTLIGTVTRHDLLRAWIGTTVEESA
jgi:CBS domain-containing protein